MANKNGKQGAERETEIARLFQAQGRDAERLAKRGIKGEPDVRVRGRVMLPAVYWKNLIKRPGQRRRSVKMVTVLEKDFHRLTALDKDHEYGYYIQSKATETLSVRATLEMLIAAITKGRYT